MRDRDMGQQSDAKRQLQGLLAQGWVWRDSFSDVLVHPSDHSLAVRYDRAADTLRMSAALAEAIKRVIPTPAGRSRHFWRDEQQKARTPPG
jgi:hypothetical protein